MFNKPSYKLIQSRLEIPSGKLNMVLDTDTFNEIDDQFALVYALQSYERLNVEAVYAAPFSNELAATPAEGMEKSYGEILRLFEFMSLDPDGLVLKGSDRYLESLDTPVRSEASLDLVQRAMEAKEPLYIAAIAAITNIASAILIEPRIIEKIVVIWLGGHSLYWPDTDEFNLKQDVLSAQVLFDCGVPVIQIPCLPVASHLTASVYELDHHLNGKNAVGTYLAKIFREYQKQHKRLTKEIWDISAVAALVNPLWIKADTVHSPILADHLTWGTDTGRHFIKSVRSLDRDAIFRDLYQKIQSIS